MSIEFKNNSATVKENLTEAVSAFLYLAGGELQTRARRNSRVDTGQTKGSYRYKVIKEENTGTVYVGSNLENAIWEEFGTGEYALNDDGRKGGWTYKSLKDGKFYRTKGKTPQRPLFTAFSISQTKLKALLESTLQEKLEG